MMGLIINNLLQGFALALFLYFTGYTVPLIYSLARWK